MVNVVKYGNLITVVDGKVAITHEIKDAKKLVTEMLHAINPDLRIVDKRYVKEPMTFTDLMKMSEG